MVPSLEVVLAGVSKALFLVLSFYNLKEMELTECLKANVSNLGQPHLEQWSVFQGFVELSFYKK